MRHTKHPTRSVTRQTDVFTLQRGRGLPPSSSHASPLFTETDFDGHVSQVSPPPTNPKPPSNPLTSRHCRREGGGREWRGMSHTTSTSSVNTAASSTTRASPGITFPILQGPLLAVSGYLTMPLCQQYEFMR